MLTLHVGQPFWLAVVFGGAGHCVEEHQDQYQPVKVSGLDCDTTVLPEGMVQLAQLVTGGRQSDESPGGDREDRHFSTAS